MPHPPLSDSVVVILGPNGGVVGTGFVAAKRLILTCAHVVEAAQCEPGGTLRLRFYKNREELSARVRPDGWSQPSLHDVAALDMFGDLPAGVGPVELGEAKASVGHPFSAFGFAPVTKLQFLKATGEIKELLAPPNVSPRLQLTSQEPDEGMSGAPVLDEIQQKVVGMIGSGIKAARPTKNIFTAFAIPSETLRRVYPPLTLSPAPRPLRLWMFAGAAVLIGGLILSAVAAALGLFSPTPTPALIARPTQTPNPTPTATPLPQLKEFTPPGFTLGQLRAVAANGGHVWFAARDGLIEYDAASTRLTRIGDWPLEAVAVEPGGGRIWFSQADGPVGTYTIGEAGPTTFILEADGQPLVNEALSILIAPGAPPTVWFGDTLNGLIRYIPGQTAERMPPPTTIPTLSRAEAVALGSLDPLTLWVDGGSFVFGWQADQWNAFDEHNTSGKLPEGVEALAVDAFGRLWLAHGQGLSLLERGNAIFDLRDDDWHLCNSASSGGLLPDDSVWSLTTSDDGSVLWIATAGGLARLEVTADMALDDCGAWQWTKSPEAQPPWPKSPQNASFWEGPLQLAVDERASAQTVWIVKQNSGEVLYLDWR